MMYVNAVNGLDNFSLDSGGRVRVSQITTLLDGKILGSEDNDLFENVGPGSALYSNNKVDMSVTSGQYKIRQTKRYAPYFSGKSQLIECTFDKFLSEANVTKRVGYFSSSAVAPYNTTFDGFFIEDNGTIKSLKAYRAGVNTIDIALTAMDNYAAIASYNWDNFTVIAFDFLWLGGAVLRFFVKTQNGFELIHTVNYSGTAQDVFILSPNQPLRYEIVSTTGAGSFRYICSQVATEGSVNEGGKTLSLFNSTSIDCDAIGTIYAIRSLRKQVAFRDVAVQILDISVSVTATADAGILMLIINPTLSAPITYSNRSKIQEGIPTNQTVALNTGRVVCATNVNVSGSSSIIKENILSYLSQSITNTMDEYVLCYMPSTINQKLNGIISLKEY